MQDREFARGIAEELSKAGFQTWSMDEVLPGDNVFLKLGNALEKADALVVLLSPQAVQSPNLSFEIGYAIRSERFEDRVIPVLVRPTEQIPWILEQFQTMAGKNPRKVGKQVVERLRQTVGV
jgi:hypothetical protein